MAFDYQNAKGTTYYLHGRETTLKNGTKQTIYFFAKDVKDGAMDAVPAGYQVAESKNGLPVLKKAVSADAAGKSEKPAKAEKSAKAEKPAKATKKSK